MANNIKLIEYQVALLRKKYPYLYFQKDVNFPKIFGTVFFEDNGILGKYDIEIILSKDYPNKIPLVRESKGEIPKSYHHNDEYLCLEIPFRVWEIFRQDETLLNFVDNLVIPYLAIFANIKEKKYLSREHPHGAKGVLDDYKKRFNVNDDLITFKLLRILAEGNYRGHVLCPCGSKKKFKQCHGMCIFNIVVDNRFRGYDFMQDFLQIAIYLKNANIIDNYKQYMSEKVVKYIKKSSEKKWNY